MKIPTKVKVGGHIINVVVTTDGDNIEFNEIGKTLLAKDVIYLNGNYSHSRQSEALLHELIHNCFYDLREEQSEALVERLGVALYQIIVDNPEVFIIGGKL